MRSASWILVAMALSACTQDQTFVEQKGSDTWAQAANNKVDILFVVDNSCSMEQEQATLAQGFVSFAEKLDQSMTEFHLGVISTTFEYTDPERGKLIGDPLYLTNEDEDYVAQFASRAQLGVSGSDKEKGLEAAAYALSPLANLDLNEGFSRVDARLLVVFVSDEEDCSDEGALIGQDAESCYTSPRSLVPIGEYVETFRGMRDSADDVQVAAIVGVEDQICQDVYANKRYSEVARLTGGQVGNICEGNWSEMLTNLGLNATGVIQSFQLSNAVKEGSLEVFVDDTLTTAYTYDPESWFIHFDDSAIPPRGSEIVANYVVQPGAPRPEGL